MSIALRMAIHGCNAVMHRTNDSADAKQFDFRF
jgi:hypothetical protein